MDLNGEIDRIIPVWALETEVGIETDIPAQLGQNFDLFFTFEVEKAGVVNRCLVQAEFLFTFLKTDTRAHPVGFKVAGIGLEGFGRGALESGGIRIPAAGEQQADNYGGNHNDVHFLHRSIKQKNPLSVNIKFLLTFQRVLTKLYVT